MLKKASSLHKGKRLQCIIAILWLFGKRITEVLTLTREDIWVEGDYLFVYFVVRKKKRKSQGPLGNRFLKKIRLDHPYTKYIVDYISQFEKGYIFPSYGKGHRVKIPVKHKDGSIIYHEHVRPSGVLSDARVRQLIKKVNANCYPHFFRESLATKMAEEGATEYELMYWFDWDTTQSPSKYVKRGTKLTEKWSERKW